jgi:hypothetical protein
VTIAATTTTSAATPLAGNDENVLVYNASATGIAFVRVDGSTCAATLSDTPIPPGGRLLLQVSPYATMGAVILSTSTGNVYFTRGSGSSY